MDIERLKYLVLYLLNMEEGLFDKEIAYTESIHAL